MKTHGCRRSRCCGRFVFLVATLFAISASTALAQTSLDAIRQSFQNPPDDARIMMRWWWFGPAVTKPELERELRAMKQAGIGGVELQSVYPLALDGDGIKTLPFLSDEYLDALRFTAAKARELGMRLDLTLGSGWPYGGPMVPVNEAAGKLRVERFRVNGSYRRLPLPEVTTGEKLLAAFIARVRDDSIASDTLRELTDIKDGIAWLPAGLEGPHEVFFFIASRTGVLVNRRCVGAEGFVLDHYDRLGTMNYLKHVGDRLMQAFDSKPPYAIFCDSLEVDSANWTGDFMEEFHKRRGYDLKPHLLALIGDFEPEAVAVRHDWGQTLTELFNDNFMAAVRNWARQHGTKFRVQCYGIPPAILSSNALADLPEGEGSQWQTLSPTRWASSAGHLYGHPITSSETWTWLHSPSFRATPLDLKAEADRHFLEGINQLVGHGWPYSPESVEYPGWRFYAAGACQRQESLVDRHAGRNGLFAAVEFAVASGAAGQRHRPVLAQRRRLGPLQPAAHGVDQ